MGNVLVFHRSSAAGLDGSGLDGGIGGLGRGVWAPLLLAPGQPVGVATRAVLGLGIVAYTPNPVSREHPGVGHARKPGDPFRTRRSKLGEASSQEAPVKCSSFVSALLLVAPPAFGQCTAFLIPTTTRATADEAGISAWWPNRSNPVVGYPARSPTARSPEVLIESRFLQFASVSCDPEGFVVNKKTSSLKLWVKIGGDFEAVWAQRKDLVEVPYSPVSGPTGSPAARNQLATENLAAIDRAAALVQDRLQKAGVNQQDFAVSFDKVWAALVEALTDQKWPIETIDKSSGLITTKATVDSEGGSMMCATPLVAPHKTWLNVFVKRTESGVRVKVNVTFRAIREDQAISCYSNGALEKSLFDAITKHL